MGCESQGGNSADCYMKKVSAQSSETVTSRVTFQVKGYRQGQTLIFKDFKGNRIISLSPEDLLQGPAGKLVL